MQEMKALDSFEPQEEIDAAEATAPESAEPQSAADPEATPDAGFDAAPTAAAEPGFDVAPEAAPDAGFDGAPEAAPDAGFDGAPEAAPDAGFDTVAAPSDDIASTDSGEFSDIHLDNGGSIAAMAFVTEAVTAQAIATRLQERSLSALICPGGVHKSVERFQGNPSPKLLFVDLSGLDHPMTEIDALAEVCEPGTTVIAIGDQNDVQLYRSLMGAGITDYLVKPLNDESIDMAVETAAEAPAAGAQEGSTNGKIIAFVGAHGGVGATTLAVNTGWALATEMKKQVAIVDLDLKFGSVSLALDIEPGRGLREALQHPERIDSLFVAGAAVGINDRFYVLGSEEPLEDGVEFHPDALELLLAELRRSFDVVILDIPRSVAVQQQAALAEATVAVVSDMSLLGVRDTLRLSGFAKRAYTDSSVITVVNRVGGDKKNEVPRKDFEKGIEAKIDVIVPEDKKAVAAASHAGKPIETVAKRAKVVSAVREIAKAAATPAEDEKSEKKGKKDTKGKKDKKDNKERQPLWRRKKEK